MGVVTIKSTYVFIRARSQNSPSRANAILWRALASHACYLSKVAYCNLSTSVLCVLGLLVVTDRYVV